MVTSAFVYNGVNVVLAVACLVSIFLVFRFVPDSRARLLLMAACVLIILTGGILVFCLKVYKMLSIAYTAEAAGMETGVLEQVILFRDLALLGSIFELVAIGLLAGASKRLISLQTGELTGEETSQ
ncbi:MAG: hypothetical protein JSV16_16680 [Candidatus Hydrogenedentota bacterium]|nr:MAG: hypothetical protein JSV16_16680 [Candidatus Hydrogenedentota bacterium]